jgi:hypothetical protein
VKAIATVMVVVEVRPRAHPTTTQRMPQEIKAVVVVVVQMLMRLRKVVRREIPLVQRVTFLDMVTPVSKQILRTTPLSLQT